jgi:hypothetical protein
MSRAPSLIGNIGTLRSQRKQNPYVLAKDNCPVRAAQPILDVGRWEIQKVDIHKFVQQSMLGHLSIILMATPGFQPKMGGGTMGGMYIHDCVYIVKLRISI